MAQICILSGGIGALKEFNDLCCAPSVQPQPRLKPSFAAPMHQEPNLSTAPHPLRPNRATFAVLIT
jgi:hypothetical protein